MAKLESVNFINWILLSSIFISLEALDNARDMLTYKTLAIEADEAEGTCEKLCQLEEMHNINSMQRSKKSAKFLHNFVYMLEKFPLREDQSLNIVFWAQLLHESIKKVSSYSMFSIIHTLDMALKKNTITRNVIACLFMDYAEGRYYDQIVGSLLDKPLDCFYNKKYNENIEEQRLYILWKMEYFQALLQLYTDHRLFECIPLEGRGATGCALNKYSSTPLQYAWLQDYMRASYEYSGCDTLYQDDVEFSRWEVRKKGHEYSKKRFKFKPYFCGENFEYTATFQVITALKNAGYSLSSMHDELKKAFGFTKEHFQVPIQKQFRDFIKEQVEVPVQAQSCKCNIKMTIV